VDKNRDFIKELEEKKRKEKEDQKAEENRKLRLRMKLKKSILQRAASTRAATEEPTPEYDTPANAEAIPEVNDVPEKTINAETEEEKKARMMTKRKLLQKQQAVLEALNAKKKEKLDELEAEKLKANRKKELARKASLGGQVHWVF